MNHTRHLSSVRHLFTLLLYGFSMLLASMHSARAEESGKADRTLSPYFFVKSDDASVDQLPLKSTQVDVRVAGFIADVTVTQTYANSGRTPLEATYVFPASTRAAVHGMKMTIGERVVTAKIAKREDARQQYEQAKQQGKSASLLEQQRPNVFQMNLANIMPGDEIKVELKYTELIVPEDGVYEFVYPTVVGPRYSNLPASKATPNDKWVANPTLRQGVAPTSTLDIKVDIAGGMPVKDVAFTSHKTNISFDGPQSAAVRLDPQESRGGNRDFILRYRLAGNQIQSGLLLQQGNDENFFLLTMQPPKRVAPSQIPGREYIFIVDVSGSMHGFPLQVSKELLRNLIGKLRETDRFNVLLFAGGSTLMAEQSVPATQDNIRRAIDVIDRQQGGGATELLPAMKRALALKPTKGYSRSIVIATDGYVTVEEEVFDLIRNNLDQSNMFTFGIGTSVNRHLLEGMARVGQGEPFVLTSEAEARAEAERFRKIIESPVLTGIRVRFDGFDAYDVEPLKVPDILSERPLVLFGKWRGKPAGKILVTGTAGNGPFSETVEVKEHGPTPQASALPYLWARHRITLLSDYNQLNSSEKRVDEVTKLGLKYNLLTAYTSFIAIDSEVRNKQGTSAAVTQPLPLPQGVSDMAVGQGMVQNIAPMPYSPPPKAVAQEPMYRAAPSIEPKMELRAPPSVAASKVTLPANVLFEFNKASLTPQAKAVLDALAAQAQKLQLEVILTVGHADRLEGETGGQKLSEQRAAAVRDYLVSKGISQERIYTEGKGNKQPTTNTANCKGAKDRKLIDCLAPDRRVDLEVIGQRK